MEQDWFESIGPDSSPRKAMDPSMLNRLWCGVPRAVNKGIAQANKIFVGLGQVLSNDGFFCRYSTYFDYCLHSAGYEIILSSRNKTQASLLPNAGFAVAIV